MFKVKAQAKPRTYNGHQFNDYWCAGLHWPGLESQVRDLTENQLKEMQSEESKGHPIRIISFIEIVELKDSNFIPAPVEVTPEATKTESTVQGPVGPTLEPVTLPPVVPPASNTDPLAKKPWET